MSLIKKLTGSTTSLFKKVAAVPAVLLGMIVSTRAFAGATDLLASGKDTVAATFGADSTIVGWLILFEVIAGIIMYTMTKNVKFLVGFIVVAVVINIGLTVAGY